MNTFREIEEALKTLEDVDFRACMSKDYKKHGFQISGWYSICEDLKVYILFSWVDGDEMLERWISDDQPPKYYESFQALLDDHAENDKYIIKKLYREIYKRKLDCNDEDVFNHIRKRAFNIWISKENVIKAIQEVFN